MSNAGRRRIYQVGDLFTHVILGVTVVLVIACNARVEGCLDVEAENFDVTIDKHDPAECNYPDLQLKVQYSWDTLSFTKEAFFTNDLGQLIAFEEVYIHVSQIVLNGK